MDIEIKKEVLRLYFEEEKKQIEIANILGISKYKVSRLLTSDDKYLNEKNKRKELNRKRHKEKTKNIIYQKRTTSQLEYERIKISHIQASRELSENRGISNRAFRNWNSSIYGYNSNTKSYNLKRGINVTSDVPRKISWKGY